VTAGDWLAARSAAVLERAVHRMPEPRQDWGRALLAELTAAPPGWARARWSLSGLWFVLRNPRPGRQLSQAWARVLFAGVGALHPAFWAYVFALQLTENDAPDIPRPENWLMFLTALALVLAFVAACWLRRAGAVLVWIGLLGYIGPLGYLAVLEGQNPLLPMALFGVPPLFGAVPLTFLAGVPPQQAAR